MARLTIDELANFCKRKGFVYPTAEIYGGFSGFFDFGPLGVELKNNIKNEWWKFHVQQRDDVVGLDGSIITNPKIWEASGHTEKFIDVRVFCKNCKKESKIDPSQTEVCEECGKPLEIKEEFNPMFKTIVGPSEKGIPAYLRPETAQMIFANFKSVYEVSRLKLPFGIAQIGKSFRNEIAPRNFLFRCREFEQMELEYFTDPNHKNPLQIKDISIGVYSKEMQKKGEPPKTMSIKEALSKKLIKLPWHAYWLSKELEWFISLGVNPKNLRIRQHKDNEKSHYATDTWDIEYNFPFGWKELEGIADRGTFDLKAHEKASKKELRFVTEKGEKILPQVIAEPSLGVERAFIVFLLEAYTKNNKDFTILRLHPKLAPVKAAILPLVRKEKSLVKIAKDLYSKTKQDLNVVYDQSGSIGRRYARNDEIGTPFCVTIDNESEKNADATIRNRDDGKQKRIKLEKIPKILRELCEGKKSFKEV
ncbi:glycine--tRNA ligase [Candidatus Pacearchaeota archaeon]|nr:MAG: glycine--tRNA ligase [Candidatus Pacearchaeota archaeon]